MANTAKVFEGEITATCPHCGKVSRYVTREGTDRRRLRRASITLRCEYLYVDERLTGCGRFFAVASPAV